MSNIYDSRAVLLIDFLS